MSYDPYEVASPDGWFRTPGIVVPKQSHWDVFCSSSVRDEDIIRLFILGWYQRGILLDAHERLEHSKGRRIQYRLEITPPFGESACETLTQWRCTEVERIYRPVGNHTFPPDQKKIPTRELKFSCMPELIWIGRWLHQQA